MGVDCLSLPPCASAHVLYPMQEITQEEVRKVLCHGCKRIGSMVVFNTEVLQCSVCYARAKADPELRARDQRIEEETAAKRALRRAFEEKAQEQKRNQRFRGF